MGFVTKHNDKQDATTKSLSPTSSGTLSCTERSQSTNGDPASFVLPRRSSHGTEDHDNSLQHSAGALSARWLDRTDSSEAFEEPKEFDDGVDDKGEPRASVASVASVATSTLEAPSQQRRKRSHQMDELTINKLRQSLGLHGRDTEIQQLQERLKHLDQQHQKKKMCDGTLTERANKDDLGKSRELVIISGYSGTGKSALARTLRKPVQKLHGLYASGKFERTRTNEPLTGVTAACSQVCAEILALSNRNTANDKTRFQEIRDKIIDQLGSELKVITRVLPALEEAVLHERDFRMEEDTGTESTEESKNQFNFAFRRFIRVVSSCFAPLVIVLDDLQWADSTSLDLLDVLLTDRENPNLMIVGLYRSNEVSDTHALAKLLRDLSQKKSEYNLSITDIQVGNLDLVSANKMIQEKIADDSSNVLGLAEICMKKTGGNVFFLIRYLYMLTEKKLLNFNLGLFKWTWDVEEIEKETRATKNVVDMLKDRMEDLPGRVCQMLKLCAVLGTTINKQTLIMVWRELYKAGTIHISADNDALVADLKKTEEEGFLEFEGGSTYRWVHDKIQEAAMSLLPEGETHAFSHCVGEILVANLDENELEAAIFTAVDLLNEEKRPAQESECIKLAGLNLRAAQKAALQSSFASAANYAGKGIENLPEASWSTHYKLTLDLYSLAAEAESTIGNTKRTECLCRAVVDDRNGPIADKLPAYVVMMGSIANGGHVLEGLEMGLDVLKRCGCRFPRTKIGITYKTLAGIMKLKAKVNEYCSMETLNKMTTMDDPFRLQQMRVMNKLMVYAYFSRPEYFPLLNLCNLSWTMKYGLSEYSPSPFSAMGVFFVSIGDLQTAAAYAKHGIAIATKLESRSTMSHVMMISYSHVLAWTNPLQNMLKPLLKSYELGMQTGDIEYAGWGIYNYMQSAFLACRPLEALAEDGSIYSRQFGELGKTSQVFFINLLWQVCENLMGRSEDPIILTGVAMDEDDYTKKVSGEHQHLLPMMVCYQIYLYGFFSQYEKCAELALKHSALLLKSLPGSYLIAMSACPSALSFCAMARQKGIIERGKYKRAARKLLSKVLSWIEQGNPNMKHLATFLQAELAVVNGKKFAAKDNYESALILACRFGFIQDAALICERYGDFLIFEMDDRDNGVYQLEQAVRYYREWGAFGKVDQVERKYAGLWSKPGEIMECSNSCSNPPFST